MARFNFKHAVRRLHRWLGVLIGVQFLMWTLGGVYFSWTNIAEIRGDDRLRKNAAPDVSTAALAPKDALAAFARERGDKHVAGVRLVAALGDDFYEFTYHDGEHHGLALVSASDGSIRAPFGEEEARRIAAGALAKPETIVSATYLTHENVGAHHEYREKPLPAWALTLADGATVYVAADNGQLQNIRGGGWRVYDFLWMLHTMGFADRDDFNNYILRAFSLLGLATVLSGFALFAVSSKTLRRVVAGRSRRGVV